MTDLTNSIKDRLAYYIDAAIGGEVSTNWHVAVGKYDDKPISTIKFEPLLWDDPTYGRLVPQSGAFVEINFTIFINEDVDRDFEDEHPYNYKALDAADLVVDYLLTISGNESERANYNIHRIYDIQVNEGGSDRSGRPRDVAIVSIKGKIQAKWLD